MNTTAHEQQALLDIERWQASEESSLRQAFNLAMRPVDWVTQRSVPEAALAQADAAVLRFFDTLGDLSRWSVSLEAVLVAAGEAGVVAARIEDLRGQPLDVLDPLAQQQFKSSAISAAIEGGGAGLGGVALLVADIPALFAINLRLILQAAAVYGFDLRDTEFRPLVMAIFNVAACGTPQARHQALREMSVAASALAGGGHYLGRVSGSFSAQNRHVPREIAKHLLSRKLAQAIPLAGAAVGAGVNYWFTTQTAQAAFMCMRALHLEYHQRAPGHGDPGLRAPSGGPLQRDP